MPEGPVPVVLAAGLSRRMGAPKLTLPLRGEPVLARTVARVEELLGISPVVVTGPDGPVATLAQEAGWSRIVNPDPSQGIGSSLAAAARHLQAPAVLVFLGDQPDVPKSAVRAVLAAWEAHPALWAVTVSYGGVPGHPVLLAGALFPRLRALTGDRGARAVLKDLDPGRVVDVFLTGAPPPDLDTPEDYQAMQRGEMTVSDGGD